MPQSTLFSNEAFVVRSRPKPANVDALPKGQALKDAKKVFAQHLAAYPGESYSAAALAVGENLAGYVYALWENDLDVREYIKDIKATEEAEDIVLGTKTQLCKKLMDMADEYKINNPKEALQALTLVAEMRGFKQKPADVQVNNQQIVNKVMVVKHVGDTEEEWEQIALKQQRELTGVQKRPDVIDVD